jgi:hypothetical protein
MKSYGGPDQTGPWVTSHLPRAGCRGRGRGKGGSRRPGGRHYDIITVTKEAAGLVLTTFNLPDTESPKILLAAQIPRSSTGPG